MPSHTHGIFGFNITASGLAGVGSGYKFAALDNEHQYLYSDMLANAGGGNAHNNLSPYQVLYMWLRTA